MEIHFDFAVSKDCKNLEDTYGEICVKCNKCGRFDEKERKGTNNGRFYYERVSEED